MSEEEQLIKVFYTCFQQLDWKGMLNCYHEEVSFYDPVFENLEGPQVRAMWQMLLTSAKDLQLSFSNIQIDPASAAENAYGSCDWVATYTFSQTGRQVINKGTALFTFGEGKIAEHQDSFSLWRWSRQALGIPGILFGWTPVLQNKIRQQARKSLEKFMTRNTPGKP